MRFRRKNNELSRRRRRGRVDRQRRHVRKSDSAPAAENWRSFPQSTLTIPTFSIGQVAGDALLERYTRESALRDDAAKSRTILEMF